MTLIKQMEERLKELTTLMAPLHEQIVEHEDKIKEIEKTYVPLDKEFRSTTQAIKLLKYGPVRGHYDASEIGLFE